MRIEKAGLTKVEDDSTPNAFRLDDERICDSPIGQNDARAIFSRVVLFKNAAEAKLSNWYSALDDDTEWRRSRQRSETADACFGHLDERINNIVRMVRAVARLSSDRDE